MPPRGTPDPAGATKPKTILYASAVGLAAALAVFGLAVAYRDQLASAGFAGPVWYVILILVGLASSGLLFGVLHSYARVHGNVGSAYFELGGPAAMLLIIVVAGFEFSPVDAAFDMTFQLVKPNGGGHARTGAVRATLDSDRGPANADVTADGRGTFVHLPADLNGQNGTLELIGGDNAAIGRPFKVTIKQGYTSIEVGSAEQSAILRNSYVRLGLPAVQALLRRDEEYMEALGKPYLAGNEVYAAIQRRLSPAYLQKQTLGADIASAIFLRIDNTSSKPITDLQVFDSNGLEIGSVRYLPAGQSVLVAIEIKPFPPGAAMKKAPKTVRGKQDDQPIEAKLRALGATGWAESPFSSEIGVGYVPSVAPADPPGVDTSERHG